MAAICGNSPGIVKSPPTTDVVKPVEIPAVM